ncbi:MAG: DUF2400 domain-containing protein [Thermoplasmata archaeon]|nr:DUF2400 domain-containing protein [Thermoplasmata archaeon]
MVRPHRPTPQLPAHLRALYRGFPFERSLAEDPLSLVRPHAGDPRSAEIAGLFAAVLAIGNTAAIRRAFSDLETRIGPDWAGFVDRADTPATRASLEGFRHRWIRADQMLHLARRLKDVYASGSSLEPVFLQGTRSDRGFAGGIAALSAALRGPDRRGHPAPPGYDRLFPSPSTTARSPCKRLTLYVRWMVRREYPDLGLWGGVDPSILRIPLDQHVHWIAYHLGLTGRRTRSWAAVEEITEALRAVDPLDPIRFDFVLCHTGISGDCPKHRDIAVCGHCAVRPDCRLWARSRGASG